MAILGRRQPHAPLILRAGGQPSKAQLFQVSRQSINAATQRFHPPVQVAIKRGIGLPSKAKIVQVTVQSRNAATQKFHPPVEALIKQAGGQPATAQSFQVSRQSVHLAVRVRSFRPTQVTALKPSGGPATSTAPVGQAIVVSRMAVNAATRLFHPLVQTAIKRAGGPPSTSRIFQVSIQSRNIDTIRFRPLVKVIIKTAGGPAVVVPPVGKIIELSRIAINATGRFHAPVKVAIKAAGSPAVIPPPGGVGTSRFYIPRDPNAPTRSRQHMDQVQMLLNSVSGSGYVRLTGLQTFTIVGGCIQAARSPLVTDDISVNVQPGMMWQNTASGSFYICRSNTLGAAVWAFVV